MYHGLMGFQGYFLLRIYIYVFVLLLRKKNIVVLCLFVSRLFLRLCYQSTKVDRWYQSLKLTVGTVLLPVDLADRWYQSTKVDRWYGFVTSQLKFLLC